MSLLRKVAPLLALGTTILAAPAAAGQSPKGIEATLVARAQTAAPAQVERNQDRQFVLEDQNAEQTRERLRKLFEQYPPTLQEVLRRDPSLLGNGAYLGTYPLLSAFLSQHPEVAHNPVYFLGSPYRDSYTSSDPSNVKVRAVEGMFTSLTVVMGLISLMTLIGFVAKSLVDHRRWIRASKMQTEAHTKVIDRLSSNDDLLAYIQTPAGQRYLESAPAGGTVMESPMSAPYSRILWSVQAGVVATIVGTGFLFVSNRWSTLDDWSGDFSRMLFLVGVVVLAAGIGFVLSGVASVLISRKFGLIPTGQPHA